MLEGILADFLEKKMIWEGHLKTLPILKNCENWNKVQEIGSVDHKMKYSHYKGGIVKYNGSFYFLPEERIEALTPYRPWRFKSKIRVLSKKEYHEIQERERLQKKLKKK